VDPLYSVYALAILALVVASVGFALLVRRRRARARSQLREREDAGLRGLVRMMDADRERQAGRKPKQ
jgi:membrane protein implicated in regulation of membrane protease activity